MLFPRPAALLLLAACFAASPVRAADAPAAEEKAALLDALAKAKYRFNPAVRAAYLKYAKAETLAEVKAAGKELPQDFLDWAGKDPLVEATAYAARPHAAPVLMELCSLWQEAGPKDADKYRQLLLAAAIACDADGPKADLTPRKPGILDIPAPPDTPLPKRDPAMTPAEAVLFLVRNDECKFDGSEDKTYREKKEQEYKNQLAQAKAEELARKKEAAAAAKKGKPAEKPKEPVAVPRKPSAAAKRKWPLFDVQGTPWPLLTPLFMNRLPLREAEFIWQEFRTTGKVEFAEAVSVDPSPYGPGSFQDIRRSEGADKLPLELYRDIALGVPAMMGKHYEYNAGCTFAYGPDGHGKYALHERGRMGPYAPQEAEGWPFGPAPARGLRPKFWQQGIVYAMNRGLKEYLDSCIVLDAYLLLDADLRKAHGADLLQSGLVVNPYNPDLAAAFGGTIATAEDAVDACAAFDNALLGARGNGCPQDSPYAQTFRGGWMGRLSGLPVPKEKPAAKKVLGFLRQQKYPDVPLRLRYQAAAEGEANVRDQVSALIDAHLAAPRTPEKCRALADQIKTAAAALSEVERGKWVKDQYDEFTKKGQTDYFFAVQVENPYVGAKDAHPRVVVQKMMLDDCVTALAALDKELPLATEAARREKMLEQVGGAFRKHLASKRDPQACQAMACQIALTASQIENEEKRRTWLKGLASEIAGKAAYLDLVQLKEASVFFPSRILNDECDKAIVDAMPGGAIQDPEAKRWEKPLDQAVLCYKRHVASHRTGGSCQHVALLIEGLAGSIRDEKQKKEWLKDLYRAVAGRENYATVGGLNAPKYRDGSADTLAKLLGLGAKPMPKK